MSCIYMISGCQHSPRNLGDLAYLGLTKKEGVERIEEHLGLFNRGTHPNQIIQNYYNDYGKGCLLTGIVIECPRYYLNSLERFYIANLTTYTGVNPYAWNRSRGGEGAKRYSEPFLLTDGENTHYGNELYPFLTGHKDLEPENILKVLDGSLQEYKGWHLK